MPTADVLRGYRLLRQGGMDPSTARSLLSKEKPWTIGDLLEQCTPRSVTTAFEAHRRGEPLGAGERLLLQVYGLI